MAETTDKLSLSEVAPALGFAGNNLMTGTPYLLPDIDVTRSFSNAEDATTYILGPEFQRKFNPNKDTHLGIRADFQGVDRDMRLPQSVIDAEAKKKIDALKQSLTPSSTQAEANLVRQQINQIQNRAWYSKRFFTDINALNGVEDVNFYLRHGLKQSGMFVDSSPLTVIAGSNPSEMIPLSNYPAFGGHTTNFNTGQNFIKGWKKEWNFPEFVTKRFAGNEGLAASYISTNTRSELFPTAQAIEKFAKPAGNINIDKSLIELEGRMSNPLVYGVKPVSPSVRLAGNAAFGASLLLDAPENYYKYGKREKAEQRTKADANWWQGNAETYKEKPETLAEKLVRVGRAARDSALTSLTFGATSGQPDRTGMSRIGQTRGGGEVGADESRRALIERSKNWIPE